ncbi:putative membrane protein [Candidatus Ichthyocystis hellenicum]|uniref:Putative membrane protein n=1 Tax=Candidatus Ichthyocystis hellenicum TaxID=1561003 RepID=A0A0S4M3J6_9BURK|nr:hypothetical protein [Candidatus Ichthyocystis hellenicum]CUT18345.1 putative membrane protein [Candidatus Ichthyocystis hellenicum]
MQKSVSFGAGYKDPCHTSDCVYSDADCVRSDNKFSGLRSDSGVGIIKNTGSVVSNSSKSESFIRSLAIVMLLVAIAFAVFTIMVYSNTIQIHGISGELLHTIIRSVGFGLCIVSIVVSSFALYSGYRSRVREETLRT